MNKQHVRNGKLGKKARKFNEKFIRDDPEHEPKQTWSFMKLQWEKK